MGTVMSLNANSPFEAWFPANTRGTESSFHGRSRRGERQSIRGRGVSNCPISGCGLRSVHRARRIVRMAAHSHDHGHVRPGHPHAHDHGHAGHAHPTLRPSVLGWAMAATLGLVVAEVCGGLLGPSVALLNDAVHNLSDRPPLALSSLAMRWADRPADTAQTYRDHPAAP